MTKPFTLQDIQKSACAKLNPHIFEKPVKKRNKYGANKKEVDGIVFASTKEADYYGSLKLLLKAGKIGMLKLQVPYELNPGGSYSLKYISDFEYIDQETGEKKVIDVKGFRTRDYKKKRRLMWKVHKIKIIEV